ncbi:MAG: mechanosensitive ion channel [Chloroflexi bacterium]|nr:mechanosensitive ion channel [Chloroflexota bacterium]
MAILLITLVMAGKARRGTAASIGRTRADPNIAVFVGRFAHLGVLTIGGLIALGIAGIDWTVILALAGAIGLAVSLAVQDVLKNLVAGLYLLMERPFRVGETIKVRDFTGRVEDIGIRTTVLRTDDALLVIVPNTVMFADVVVNKSARKRAQDGVDEDEKPAAAEIPLNRCQ